MEEILRSPHISFNVFLELRDYDGNFIRDITKHLVSDGSYISRDSTAPIAGMGTIMLNDISDINFRNHLLHISATMRDNTRKSNNEFTWRLGNWIMPHPVQTLSRTDLYAVEIVDVISLLGNLLEQSFTAREGRTVTSEINNLLTINGLSGLSSIIPPVGFAMVSDFTWPYIDEKSYLDISRELLNVVNYVQLYTDRYGSVTTHPWIDINNIAPVWDFNTAVKNNFISDKSELIPNNEEVPNVWIGVCDDKKSPIFGKSFKVENTNPESVYSISGQNNRRIPYIEKFQSTTETDLKIAVTRMAQEMILRTEQVKIIYGGVLPHLWASDVVNINIPRFDIISKRGVVSDWKLPFNIAKSEGEFLVGYGS